MLPRTEYSVIVWNMIGHGRSEYWTGNGGGHWLAIIWNVTNTRENLLQHLNYTICFEYLLGIHCGRLHVLDFVFVRSVRSVFACFSFSNRIILTHTCMHACMLFLQFQSLGDFPKYQISKKWHNISDTPIISDRTYRIQSTSSRTASI